MTCVLEEVTVEEFWQLYISANPPPSTISQEEIEFAKYLYYAGFGAMLVIAKRMETETPERCNPIREKLMAEVFGFSNSLAVKYGRPTN